MANRRRPAGTLVPAGGITAAGLGGDFPVREVRA
jgi:hypothetical protein